MAIILLVPFVCPAILTVKKYWHIMKDDVPYIFQTNFRIMNKYDLRHQLKEINEKFGIPAWEFYHLFLKGKIKGYEGKRYISLYEYYIVQFKELVE